MKPFALWWHRLTHWEYWPYPAIYFPILPLWLWYALRTRAVFFFTAANPGIQNGGFMMESKKSIYDLLPPDFCPATVLVGPDTPWNLLTAQMQAAGITLPCIAKPDIGLKGLQVEKIHSLAELQAYSTRATWPWLIQTLIHAPEEVGIFYHRTPGCPEGQVSGIVYKEFLTVWGNGADTVETLLAAHPRTAMQIPVLRARYGPLLHSVPAPRQPLTLVPYGNHARGAKFLDWSHKCTPALRQAIDRLCRQVPEFYYGRLDLRFDSWDELAKGRGFWVIELNGAGSEPTHIYDPDHPLWFGWWEAWRHAHLLCQISLENIRRGHQPLSCRQGIAMLKANQQMLRRLQQT